MSTSLLIGSDIGGSHITAMAVDPLSRHIVSELLVRRDVDSRAPAEVILGAWEEALSTLISMLPGREPGGIGFAMPGPFNYPAGIALFSGVKKYDSLYGINIREELGRRLGLPSSVPLRFLNDATCFAIGESWMGPASSFRRNMAITLGTGFGSAFLDDGIPVESGDEVPEAGCVYHLPFGDSNADDHFSTRWFIRRWKEVSGLEAAGVKELSDLAASDASAAGLFREFGNNLGCFLAPWLKRFGAGALTIGGNIANSYGFFGTAFEAALAAEGCYTKVFISALGEEAAIAGSARLCDDAFYKRLPFLSSK